MSVRKIRIVLIDDSRILRQSAAELLREAADIEIVGEAGDEREGTTLAMKLEPEIVLIGLSEPQAIGRLVRRLSLFCPSARALVFSMFDGRICGPAPPWSGRGVYMLTLSDLDSLAPAIRTVAALRGRPVALAAADLRTPMDALSRRPVAATSPGRSRAAG